MDCLLNRTDRENKRSAEKSFDTYSAAGRRISAGGSLARTGVPSALTDSTGTAQTSYTFEPFGNTSVTGTATTNSFAFTGRELDATGLYFFRARYYNPQLQRFLSEDPVGLKGKQINFYSYVFNSPQNFLDSLGLWGGGVVFNAGFFGGGGSGTGGSNSVGGVYIANPSSPLGFDSAGYISSGAYVAGPNGGPLTSAPFGNNGDNSTYGLNFGVGAGAVYTTANSIEDFSGPCANTTYALGALTIDVGTGANGVKVYSFTAGLGFGLGVSNYCTNTWTNPVSNASFPAPDMYGRNCRDNGCHIGP